MRNIIKFIFLSFFIISSLYGADDIKEQIKIDIYKIKNNIQHLDDELDENIWITRYNNYLAYRKIENDLEKIKKDAKKYGRWKGSKYKELSYQLTNKIKIKENELSLISEYKDSPIGSMIKPKDIDQAPKVTNPFIILEAYSYISKLKSNVKEYGNTNLELGTLLAIVNNKIEEIEKLYKLEKTKENKQTLDNLKKELKDFIMVVDIVSSTHEVYTRKIDQVILEVEDTITDEIYRTIKLLFIIFILVGITMGIKVATKKYIKEDDNHYSVNKLINFILIIIIIFIVLFSYIDNASYLVTFLGFASAGIAIALKDWFMSMFGWMAIMTSGAITVGDRIKVIRDGVEVVGDVLDISLFKIAIREDVTLTSYRLNRRSGRVYFIPNNYIFTDMIANYTYDELRTVWDGIDINITFDSNHKKAVELAKSIASAHAKGYTDLTKKRLQKMRKKYVLRSTNPEPRVFAMMEPYGITISTWYYTNSHATLALRSTISMELLEAFKAEKDIKIAYPTQTLRVANSGPIEPETLLPGTTATGLFDGPISN